VRKAGGAGLELRFKRIQEKTVGWPQSWNVCMDGWKGESKTLCTADNFYLSFVVWRNTNCLRHLSRTLESQWNIFLAH
jgi:hypothetical protein